MYIKDVFAKFTKERHAEDKGRNHDLLQEIYASTEFLDMSFFNFEKPELINFIKTEDKHYADFSCSYNFSLPFENNFIKLSDNAFLFLREYSPETITGTLYMTSEIVTINIPFTIHLNFLKSYIVSDFNEPTLEPTEILRETFTLINGVSNVIEKLSKHAVAVDVPVGTKHEYFRRKHGVTIKVPEKPIYYVLDKQEEKKKYKYNSIEARGHLEFSHAFKVRGHYRKVDDKTYGKDRNGIYKVKGYTWVVEHVRGEGDLLKKVRVIK